MSDFLATIAARTTGTELGILPRQPARFEPDALPAGHLPLVEYQDVESTPAQPPQAIDRPSSGQSRPIGRWDAPSDVPLPEPARTGHDLGQQPSRTPERSSSLLPSEPVARIDRPLPRASDQVPLERNWELPVVTAAVPTVKRVRELSHAERPPRSELPPTRLDPLPEFERVAQGVPALEPTPPSRSNDIAAIVVPTVRTTIERQHSDAVEPMRPVAQLWPAPVPDAGERAPRIAEAPPAPTINVTIGRVEIRAAAKPAREPRQPAANPAVLPLNEYLRRRKGGA